MLIKKEKNNVIFQTLTICSKREKWTYKKVRIMLYSLYATKKGLNDSLILYFCLNRKIYKLLYIVLIKNTLKHIHYYFIIEKLRKMSERFSLFYILFVLWKSIIRSLQTKNINNTHVYLSIEREMKEEKRKRNIIFCMLQ